MTAECSSAKAGRETGPLVSVCMPAYNAERYVRAAVDGVLAQTYPRVELICVDDGSSDATGEILEGYGNRIRLIRTRNQGACAARNLALTEARGEFVQFFDADNLMYPNCIEERLRGFQEQEADLVFSNQVILFDSGEEHYVRSRPDPTVMDPFVYCLKYNLPASSTAIDTNVALHRTKLVRRIGGFNPDINPGHDKDLALRLAAAGARLAYVDMNLTVYRDHAGPRISHEERVTGYPLDYFIDLAALLEESPLYDLTPARREALAGTIIKLAQQRYRAGNRALAQRGFECARGLSATATGEEGRLYAWTRSKFGYSGAERLRSLLRWESAG